MIELPVADPWFVRDRVDDSITLVTEQHVHPLLRCNVWHVRGRDRVVVIDTALGLAPLRHPVERELDGSDTDAYVATMRRLRDVPVTVVHGGHEPSFGRDRLVEICDTYLARHT